MASNEQIKALLKCCAEGEDEHFLSVALQIAADAARNGKEKLAQELKELVDKIKQKQSAGKISGAVPITRPKGELAGLLAVTYPKTRLSEMVLSPKTISQLERVVEEYKNQRRLQEHGLFARRKLLLVGPPGCGKTMTASALAGEFKLPLFSVQLHGLITKFMGETAAKLHSIFEATCQTRGIYFFDEFDAIGSDRESRNDVGEIRRVLNSFLQFLEQNESESMVIAATNYERMLDEALFRRFDDVIHYARPIAKQIDLLIKNRIQRFLPTSTNWTRMRAAAGGLSHAEIAKACDDAAKQCIMNQTFKITASDLVSALKVYSNAKKIRARQ